MPLKYLQINSFSLLIFQILWIIPQKILRWILLTIALSVSGSVLVMTFWPAVREDNRRIALATILVIVLLHLLLSVGCLVSLTAPFPWGRRVQPEASCPGHEDHFTPGPMKPRQHMMKS